MAPTASAALHLAHPGPESISSESPRATAKLLGSWSCVSWTEAQGVCVGSAPATSGTLTWGDTSTDGPATACCSAPEGPCKEGSNPFPGQGYLAGGLLRAGPGSHTRQGRGAPEGTGGWGGAPAALQAAVPQAAQAWEAPWVPTPARALGRGGRCPTVGQLRAPFLVRLQASVLPRHTHTCAGEAAYLHAVCLTAVPKVPAEGSLATLSLWVRHGAPVKSPRVKGPSQGWSRPFSKAGGPCGANDRGTHQLPALLGL